MKSGNNKGFEQAYNAQATVEQEGRTAMGAICRTASVGIILTILLLAGCNRPHLVDDIPPAESAPASPVTTAQTTVTVDSQVKKAVVDPKSVETTGEGDQVELSDQETYQGVPVGFTEEGYPYWGDPDAPISLVEYSDYLCPFCRRHFSQTLPTLLQEYGNSGQVRYVFRDFPIPSLHPTASTGHQAAWCVAEQGAAAFWAMHDELFQAQAQWSSLPDSTPFLTDVAAGIGVDVMKFDECMRSGRTNDQVEQGMADGQALGFNGTPTFQFVANEGSDVYTLTGAHPLDTFQQWMDALVAGEAPPMEEKIEVEPAELPFWANTEGLAPDPDRPGFTLAGDPYKGDPEARLAVVEFSDFQCPSCQRHALETLPILESNLIETGEILWVFKHLPLQEHPQALVAAVAAECAGDQGQFWQMHHLLFETQEQWGVDDPDPVLMNLAEKLGLNLHAFDACYNSRQALERVLADMVDAERVTTNTPTFVILDGKVGTVTRGARDASNFETVVRNLLEKAIDENTSDQTDE